jgi:hypothetical protein
MNKGNQPTMMNNASFSSFKFKKEDCPIPEKGKVVSTCEGAVWTRKREQSPTQKSLWRVSSDSSHAQWQIDCSSTSEAL